MNNKKKCLAYARLIRLHQPTGIWLLLWPCWWSLALASRGMPPLNLLILFGLGAVVMRGAGCIINDIIDRDFDKRVERTRNRPLASGEITLREACIFLFILLIIAFFIALQMNRIVLLLAAFSLLLVAAYPFMKRITWWPQTFLGITFNWGALMGFVAVRDTIQAPAIALYIACIFWTLGYDTIYAHQDKEDDIKVGIKSTALRLGAQSTLWISAFYTVAVFGWMIAGILNNNNLPYYIGVWIAALHFAWQIKTVDVNNALSCRTIFRSNSWVGWIVFIGLVVQS